MNDFIKKLKERWNDWRNPPQETAVELKATVTKVESIGDTPLTRIKGVGPSTAAKFNDFGIMTIEQLVLYEPEFLSEETGVTLTTCRRLVTEGVKLLS